MHLVRLEKGPESTDHTNPNSPAERACFSTGIITTDNADIGVAGHYETSQKPPFLKCGNRELISGLYRRYVGVRPLKYLASKSLSQKGLVGDEF